MTRTFPILTIASLLTIGTPLVASSQPVLTNAQWGRSSQGGDYQRLYDNGYRTGMREGERDARSGRRRDYRQSDAFRRGSNGWGWGNSGNGDDIFRRGFAEGYSAGYDRYRQSAGRYGRPDYPSGGYGYPNDGYRSQGGSGYPGGGYVQSPAAQRGFQDGLRDGSNDARDNDRYEPTRKKKYREGDEGYNSRYGSRDQYKYEYRQSFQQGYDRGYREGRYR